MYDGTDGFPFMHQIEGFVDLIKRQTVRDERVEIDFTDHGIFNHTRQLGTPFYATKCGATPYAASDQLEWTGFDFLTCTGHANDDAFAPSLVAALEC
ncbi:hypothetical protein D3C78_1331300 [compost metagenome]